MDAVNSQMDILKAKPLPLWRRRPIYVIAAAALAAALAIVAIGLLSGPSRKVKRGSVLIAEVQQGDLQVTVDGYGVLRSNEQALITALSSATVEAVLLRPGANVEADTVILRLANPDVMQELEAARIALVREQAKLRRLVLAGERDQLLDESKLAKARTQYEVQRMRNEAQREAAEQGIIPKLDYRAALVNQDLLEEAEQLQRRRTEHLKLVTREAQIIQQEEINQAKVAYQRAQQRADHLTVRAGIKGVLQRLPVELGQSVAAGQELALVGSDSNLLALLRISQSKAHQINVGQGAEINTRREKVAGIVTRVAPEVRDGTIEVEVRFKDGVPASARPELNVDAQIVIARVPQTLYIERPTNAQPNTVASLFRLQPDSDYARRQDVRFGEESGRYIQLTSGASVHDRFIISDTSAYRTEKEIALTD